MQAKIVRLENYTDFSNVPEDKIAILNSLYNETYLVDIKGRNKIRKVSELECLLNILSSNIGGLINPEKLRNTFRSVYKSSITVDTINKYM